jgi:hypothetical protein
VRWVGRRFDPATLRAVITPNAGEPVGGDKLDLGLDLGLVPGP